MSRIILIILCLLPALPGMAAVQVAASIKPLQLLAAAVTDGVTVPVLLMREGQDPHHFALRPSDRRALAESDVILWTGPALEQPLSGVMEQLSGRVITAQSLSGMTLHERGHGIDPHLWLDRGNAGVMAAELTRVLSQADPDNAARYQANLEALDARLEALDQRLRDALTGLEDRPFAVYHNAYRYLEHRYGLQHVVSFTDHEDIAPGIRRLMAVRSIMSETGARCVLVEPGDNVTRLRSILDDPALRFQVVDVLGSDRPPSADAFPAMMAEMGDAIQACLR